MDDFKAPAAILLIKSVAAWRAQHGKEPSSAAERREFKDLLRSWQHTIDGIPVEEENFTVSRLTVMSYSLAAGLLSHPKAAYELLCGLPCFDA